MSYQCLNRERKIFFRPNSAKAISNITKIVLDFDGVLVYTLQSYYANIRKVVKYYFFEVLGLEERKGERELVTLEDIQGFKDTGLYNNDWTLTYAFIIYYLAIIVGRLRQKRALDDFIKQFSYIQFLDVTSFIQTLREVGSYCKRQGLDATELANAKKDSVLGIKPLLIQVREEKQPLETILARFLPHSKGVQLKFIKKMVPYSVGKPDLLRRLFEESYLGGELFKKFYCISPVFNFNECLLEREEFIPTRDTFHTLHSKFGKLAVYSEKPRDQAIYLLEKNNLREYFDDNELVFYEDLIKSESIQLGKPDPTILIERFLEFDNIAYVGDSIADALLVRSARSQGLHNISFLGVLSSSRYPDELLSQFMEQEADAIMTDANDIPFMHASLRGGTPH